MNPKYIVEFTLQSSPSYLNSSSTLQDEDDLLEEQSITSLPSHDIQTYEYFDPVQYRPVTLQEKMSNPKISRRLITISQAYSIAFEEAKNLIVQLDKNSSIPSETQQNSSINFHSKESYLEQQLCSVDEIFREITVNYADNSENIVSACNAAIGRLQSLTRDKLELLLSIETELRREKEEIQWLEYNLKQQIKITEQFVNIQQGGGKKWPAQQPSTMTVQQQQQLNIFHLQFLKYWKNCMMIMNGLNHFHANEIEMIHDIVPDIATDCNIQVFLQSNAPTTSINNINLINSSTSNNINNNINNNNNNSNSGDKLGKIERTSIGSLPSTLLQLDRNRSASTAIPFNTSIDYNTSLPDDPANDHNITHSRPSSPPPPQQDKL